MPKKIQESEIIGKKYGSLTVLKFVESYRSPSGILYKVVLCKCKCGNEKNIRISSLMRGSTISCGQKNCKFHPNYKHGYTNNKTPEFYSWKSIINNYGKEEICERWGDFLKFLKDMGEKPGDNYRLQRINILKPYSKKNCFWRELAKKENQ